MFGSPILDVTIGLVFVYLLLSLIATAIREGLEAWLRSRAGHLERGIRTLLQDLDGQKLARWVYEHPLIYGLYADRYEPPAEGGEKVLRKSKLPSYIPSRNFAVALLDIVARGPGVGGADAASAQSQPITFEGVRQAVQNLENPPVQRALLSAIDMAQGSLNRLQDNLQEWYDSSMDRVSGWYKRETQQILIALGISVAVVGNVNTFAIARHLYRDKAAREAIVEQAANASTVLGQDIQKVRLELSHLDLPIGWNDVHFALPGQSDTSSTKDSRTGKSGTEGYWWGYVLEPMLGWLMTGLAISLGAPFWFDLLNKFMVIRSTVKPKEKSPEEGSEDRRPQSPKG